MENDVVGKTDRNYTNGVQLRYIAPKNKLPDWMDWLRANYLPRPDTDWYLGTAIGHSIFTPRNTELKVPPANQRPYSGFLYGSVSMAMQGERVLDRIVLDVGVVGPAAYGEFVQNEFHKLIGSDEAQGWDAQLDDRPGVRLTLDRTWRASHQFDLPILDLGIDATPHFALTVGNLETYAAAGTSFRFGSGLAADYGPPRVRPGLGGTGAFDPSAAFGWYAFIGIEGRYVFNDLFVEGKPFRDQPSLKLIHPVADLQAGMAFQIGNTEISYTHVFRSPQFHGQDSWSIFGSLNIRFAF